MKGSNMDRNEKYQAGMDWKRASDIPVSKETSTLIQKLACDHLAEGDAGMFKLAMSSLAKMQQTSNDSVLLQALAAKFLTDDVDEEVK